MTRERCVICGELIAADDPDALEVGGGLAHEECIEEHDDERGLFREPDSERSAATGRAAAFECSVAEIQRQRRNFRRRTP
ncbi:MAG: hypothetical protein ABSA78_01480 [Candidatus Sulfotelmatobacter sp.]|jgi:hypothetical protein